VIIITEATQTRRIDIIVELDDLKRYFFNESAILKIKKNSSYIPDPDILSSGVGICSKFSSQLRHKIVKKTRKISGSQKGLIRGKQWQTTPKNLPRMQRTRVIPVA
jgi:hypothetical protein